MDASGVVLVGCVKGKQASPAPARDLYSSPLWRARRGYAENSGRPWFVLSARYGLVEPDRPLRPYELTLQNLRPEARRRWGEQAAAELERLLGPLPGMEIEIHAGKSYVAVIAPALGERGALVRTPLASLGIGRQLRWYRHHADAVPTPSRRRYATEAEVDAALTDLAEQPNLIAAHAWPATAAHLDAPGLYAWSVDRAGAADLSAGLAARVRPGRIYTGQTGATKWPSGRAPTSTLRKRIGHNHLHGRIRGSTFRLTLAATLLHSLNLDIEAPTRLTPESERRLTEWALSHLSVALHPFPERDPLADLEHHVLATLDPPLNLDQMPPTPLRTTLEQLRRTITKRR